MVDPGYILYHLGELIADLRTWHYRVSDLVHETQASGRYSREILDRTEHEVLYLHEYAAIDLERYCQLQSRAEELEHKSDLAQAEVRKLEDSTNEIRKEAHSVRARCEDEKATAEALYRTACAEELAARSHMQECQKVVEKCRRILEEEQAALQAAERTLERAQDALRQAASRRRNSNNPVDLSAYEFAVANAEMGVASRRLDYESATAALRMAENTLSQANESLIAAIKALDSSEQRLSRCQDACLHANSAVAELERGLELLAIVLRDVEELSIEAYSAVNGCRELIEIATACLIRIRSLQDQMHVSWRVFNNTSRDIQQLTESGEAGMNCCQQAIVDLGARRLSLAQFEETSITDWRL